MTRDRSKSRDYAAEYRRRDERAKQLGYSSYWDRRKSLERLRRRLRVS